METLHSVLDTIGRNLPADTGDGVHLIGTLAIIFFAFLLLKGIHRF
ncbi:MAG: hypothetical protein WCJ64_00510 [Rhodospirillaceae bacterium]